MTMNAHNSLRPPPLVIGGVGGSGTRVVAAAAIAAGFHLGHDLNEPLDNLAFTLIFKDQAVLDISASAFAERARLFADAMTGTRALDPVELSLLESLAAADRPQRPPIQHTASWLAQRARNLVAKRSAGEASRSGTLDTGGESQPKALGSSLRWGWKEPNAHVVLPRLLCEMPGLRYVHVVRNGLDMAFSRNQNQLLFWGERWLERPVLPTPRDSLSYWCAVHQRIQRIGREMGAAFLWLDYDDLCTRPADGMAVLARFIDASPAMIPDLARLVQPQSSSGRHRDHPLDQFDPADLEYLRSIGHL